jgi:hypothetical protein
VQDIVNNLLNNLVLFQMELAETRPPGSSDPIEELILDASKKLKALGDVTSVRETTLAVGIGIEFIEPTVA